MQKQINDNQPGNIFNADRDNKGEGIKIEDLITAISDDET
jgi:hypothetical protein